ncbi:hypothetical protein X777_05807 [Ooceraea biroi]|uniref:Uncharacterized protein n=1 Tax=Ooceraea biroi TaxID=2015173 RepID=A0A026WG08_OOCBI|nr:hypothetical protein X777_05807 [Ooceraea biroi]
MERLRVWEKVDAVMASSCRQPQAPVILNRANSFAGCTPRESALPRESKMLGRDVVNTDLPMTPEQRSKLIDEHMSGPSEAGARADARHMAQSCDTRCLEIDATSSCATGFSGMPAFSV